MLNWVFKQIMLWTALALVASFGLEHLGARLPWSGPESGTAVAAGATAVATPPPSNGGSRATTIRAGDRGHFFAVADVDGAEIRFLVDTGASGVVLSPEDAERIGLRLSDSDYSLRFQTAGGIVRAAPVTLRQVRIGQMAIYGVEAAVNESSMGVSLLGVSFLSRLDGYQVQGDRLILYW
jgi:aspartyl protease family protein